MNDDTTTQNEDTVKITEELESYKSKYLRALADYQNLEKQTAVWRDDFTQYASAKVITQMLEILDDLEKAQENLKDEGLKIITNKLQIILSNEGVEVLDLEDKEYDPSLAEVVNVEPGEKDNIVVKVLQKGYKIKDRVVRPAKVVVSKNN